MDKPKKKEIKDFTDLLVWQMTHEICLDIYKLTEKLPKEEKFNTISQIRRSSASMAANIAEGYGRFSYQENIQFSRQARGSLDETRNHLIFIRDTNKILATDCQGIDAKCLKCRMVLNGYINYLKKRKQSDTP